MPCSLRSLVYDRIEYPMPSMGLGAMLYYGGRLVEFGESGPFFADPREKETRDFLSGAIG